MGLYELGFATQSSFIILCYLNFALYISDWNKLIRVFFSCNIGFYLLTIVMAQFLPAVSQDLYKHMFDVISLPKLWLALPPTIFIIYLPFYLEKSYW